MIVKLVKSRAIVNLTQRCAQDIFFKKLGDFIHAENFRTAYRCFVKWGGLVFYGKAIYYNGGSVIITIFLWGFHARLNKKAQIRIKSVIQSLFDSEIRTYSAIFNIIFMLSSNIILFYLRYECILPEDWHENV